MSGGFTTHTGPSRERRLRYCARPPFALDPLRELDAERLLDESTKRGPGGSGPQILTPLQLLDRLAALEPPPRVHRHRYFGVLAPNAPLRAAVTALAPAAAPAPRAPVPHPSPATEPAPRGPPATPGRCCWRASMKSSPSSVNDVSMTCCQVVE
jgi:hypothetical protein